MTLAPMKMMLDPNQKVRRLSLACLYGEAAYEPCGQHCETCDEPLGWHSAVGHDIPGAEEVRTDCSQVLVDHSRLAAEDTVQEAAA